MLVGPSFEALHHITALQLPSQGQVSHHTVTVREMRKNPPMSLIYDAYISTVEISPWQTCKQYLTMNLLKQFYKWALGKYS